MTTPTAAATPTALRRCPLCGNQTAASHCPKDGTSTVAAANPLARSATSYKPGEIVSGRYRVLGVLGRGGFGAVYAAEHTGTAQKVALKMLALEAGAAGGDDVVKRFYREAQVTANLSHPNTVRVFDVGQADDGPLFIAMEMLKGPSLEQVLKRMYKAGQRLSEPQVLDIAIPILKSLGEAHKAGLVHRDMKPANVMIVQGPDDEPLVKVLDFGIARAQDSSLTGSGKALGTPTYMSPEQCTGKALDGRSDLYSVGVMLYRCACGKPPFEHESLMTLMYAHTHEPPPDPAVLNVALSGDFVALLMKAMAKKPDERFADAKEMRQACEALRGGAWAATPAFGVTQLDAAGAAKAQEQAAETRTDGTDEAPTVATPISQQVAVSNTLATILVEEIDASAKLAAAPPASVPDDGETVVLTPGAAQSALKHSPASAAAGGKSATMKVIAVAVGLVAIAAAATWVALAGRDSAQPPAVAAPVAGEPAPTPAPAAPAVATVPEPAAVPVAPAAAAAPVAPPPVVQPVPAAAAAPPEPQPATPPPAAAAKAPTKPQPAPKKRKQADHGLKAEFAD
jgi:serine/threonine-protein kinase